MKAIEGDYPSHPEGVAAVHEAIISFYKNEYPEVWDGNPQTGRAAADAAGEDLRPHGLPGDGDRLGDPSNHIGHDDFPGCMRCHDDEMATADGEHVIPDGLRQLPRFPGGGQSGAAGSRRHGQWSLTEVRILNFEF